MEYSDIEQLQQLIHQRGNGGDVGGRTALQQHHTSSKKNKTFSLNLGRQQSLQAISEELGLQNNQHMDINDISQQSQQMGLDRDDSGGGVNNDDINRLEEEDMQAEEPIYFDQTTRHMGSIQKNMVLSDSHKSMLGKGIYGGPGQQGFNPASTMPNYSIMAGQNQVKTYKPNIDPQSQRALDEREQTFSMREQRLGNQQNQVDAPTGVDKVWQVVDSASDQNQKNNNKRTSSQNNNLNQYNQAEGGQQTRRYGQASESSDSDDHNINDEYYVAKKKDSFSDEEDVLHDSAAQGFAHKKNNMAASGKRQDQHPLQVLTFVDMSKLKYLSKSVSANSRLEKVKPAQKMPKDTNVAIMEDANEEDEDESVAKPEIADFTKTKNPKDLALSVISELIDIVLESAGDSNDISSSSGIVTNQLIQQNVHKIHKQVFHKVKFVDESNPNQKEQPPSYAKKSEPLTSKTFRSQIKNKQTGFRKSRQTMPSTSTRPQLLQPQPKEQESLFVSALSQAMDMTTQHDFVLAKPERGNRYALSCSIYFFDSPLKIIINIGWNELIRDVIRHVMTLYRKNKDLSETKPLQYPDNPERYQLYFIDDDESDHAPDYDMGPRNSDEPIGEFTSLAFVANKKFKGGQSAPGQSNAGESALIALQTEEQRKALQDKDQRLLIIECNTVLINKVTHTVVMDNSKQVGEIVHTLSKKVCGKIQANPAKYIIMMGNNQPTAIDNDNEALSDMFGGYNAFGSDGRVIDSKTIVRNLKTDKLELRERIFVDKPVKKQLEISLEEDKQVAGRKRNDTNQGYFTSELVNQQKSRGAQPQTMMINTMGRLESGSDEFGEEHKQERQTGFRQEEDFLYGLMTGKDLQEWEVVKFNKKNKPKERILCIDGFNLWHRKSENDRGFFSSLVPTNLLKSSKNKQKPISTIVALSRPENTSTRFVIYYSDKKERTYRTRTPDDCSEILAKLKFLRQGQGLNTNQRRMPANSLR